MEAQFYIAATPIGNLGDISIRTLEILKKVDYIVCEDTRKTKILLDKYLINTKLIDCHKFNEKERSGKIISIIKEGKTVAFVSDAGTPLISDPGSVLIKELKKENIKITALPGACAVITFLSLISRDSEEFAFIGFIPRNKQQQFDILDKYKYTNCVFYDSPNRFMNTLQNISDLYGSNKKIAVARELTKVFEEVKEGSVEEIINYYEKNPLKGEIVAMVFAQKENQDIDEVMIIDKIKILHKENFSPKDISRIISKLYGVNKNKIYKMSLETE